jgi:hypothetical protein
LCAYVGTYKASHKSNPLFIPQGYVEMVAQVWRGYHEEGYYNTLWLMGLWYTQAMVEGITPKVAWQ